MSSASPPPPLLSPLTWPLPTNRERGLALLRLGLLQQPRPEVSQRAGEVRHSQPGLDELGVRGGGEGGEAESVSIFWSEL